MTILKLDCHFGRCTILTGWAGIDCGCDGDEIVGGVREEVEEGFWEHFDFSLFGRDCILGWQLSIRVGSIFFIVGWIAFLEVVIVYKRFEIRVVLSMQELVERVQVNIFDGDVSLFQFFDECLSIQNWLRGEWISSSFNLRFTHSGMILLLLMMFVFFC